jgi:pectin methylesterase-like acyl-CoA thioesterase
VGKLDAPRSPARQRQGQTNQRELQLSLVAAFDARSAQLPRRGTGASRDGARAGDRWDAIVDPAHGTLGEALAKAEAAKGAPFHILLREGVFTEKLTVRTPNLTIVGSGPRTILSFGAYNALKRADGTTTGTSGSATLTLAAPG